MIFNVTIDSSYNTLNVAFQHEDKESHLTGNFIQYLYYSKQNQSTHYHLSGMVQIKTKIAGIIKKHKEQSLSMKSKQSASEKISVMHPLDDSWSTAKCMYTFQWIGSVPVRAIPFKNKGSGPAENYCAPLHSPRINFFC